MNFIQKSFKITRKSRIDMQKPFSGILQKTHFAQSKDSFAENRSYLAYSHLLNN